MSEHSEKIELLKRQMEYYLARVDVKELAIKEFEKMLAPYRDQEFIKSKRYGIETFSSKKPGKPRQYYFRVVSKNGQTVSTSEGYHNKSDRDNTANGLKNELQFAKIVELD